MFVVFLWSFFSSLFTPLSYFVERPSYVDLEVVVAWQVGSGMSVLLLGLDDFEACLSCLVLIAALRFDNSILSDRQ